MSGPTPPRPTPARPTPVRDRLAFDRADFTATRVVLILILVVTIGAGLGRPLVAWLSGGPIHWTVSTVTGAAPQLGVRPGVTARWNGDIDVRLAEAPATAWLAVLLPGLVLSATVALVIWLVLRILSDIQRARPFSPTTRTRLRVIALTVVIAPALVTVASVVADLAVTDAAFTDAPFAISVPAGPIVAVMAVGLVVAALGEAFGRGAVLQADVDGLV